MIPQIRSTACWSNLTHLQAFRHTCLRHEALPASNDIYVSTCRMLQHVCLKSPAGPRIIDCIKYKGLLCLLCQRNTYVTVNTNRHSGTPALTWHPTADSCRLWGEARRGSPATLSVGQYSWAWRSAGSGIPGGPTVSSVSRRVCTNPPAWCKTRQPNDPSQRAGRDPLDTDARQPGHLQHRT